MPAGPAAAAAAPSRIDSRRESSSALPAPLRRAPAKGPCKPATADGLEPVSGFLRFAPAGARAYGKPRRGDAGAPGTGMGAAGAAGASGGPGAGSSAISLPAKAKGAMCSSSESPELSSLPQELSE